jgi:hypothetical protein
MHSSTASTAGTAGGRPPGTVKSSNPVAVRPRHHCPGMQRLGVQCKTNFTCCRFIHAVSFLLLEGLRTLQTPCCIFCFIPFTFFVAVGAGDYITLRFCWCWRAQFPKSRLWKHRKRVLQILIHSNSLTNAFKTFHLCFICCADCFACVYQ